jgi:hypothetical protein
MAGRWLSPGRGPIVQRERHLLAVEIDLEHAVDRLADAGELVERGLEEAPLASFRRLEVSYGAA